MGGTCCASNMASKELVAKVDGCSPEGTDVGQVSVDCSTESVSGANELGHIRLRL